MKLQLKMMCFALIISLLGFSTKLIAEQPHINEQTNPKIILEYFTNLYGGDLRTNSLVVLNESKWDNTAESDMGLSNGIVQYQKSTFERHSKILGQKLNYNSQFDQLKLFAYIFSLNNESLKREWTAYRCIKNGGKYSFYSKQLKKDFTVSCIIK